MIRIVDKEHIEAIDITANAEVEALFKQMRDGNYKFYRAVGQPRKLESNELQCKLYKYNELTRKGEPDGILQLDPDKWFANPYYIAPETVEVAPEPTVAVKVEVMSDPAPVKEETPVVSETETLKAKIAEYEETIGVLTAENERLKIAVESGKNDYNAIKAENSFLTEKIAAQREQLRTLNEKVSTFGAVEEDYENKLAHYDELCSACKTIIEFLEKAKKYDE